MADVGFEEGVETVWAEAVMPFCDGCVLAREGKGDVEVGGKMGKEWWSNGVSLDVWVRSDVMERLVGDKGLRAFA